MLRSDSVRIPCKLNLRLRPNEEKLTLRRFAFAPKIELPSSPRISPASSALFVSLIPMYRLLLLVLPSLSCQKTQIQIKKTRRTPADSANLRARNNLYFYIQLSRKKKSWRHASWPVAEENARTRPPRSITIVPPQNNCFRLSMTRSSEKEARYRPKYIAGKTMYCRNNRAAKNK